MGKYVIVGAGVIGLYTALLLSELGIGHDIVVVAKNMPGDLSIEYTSPVAGAHFSFDVASGSAELLDYCKISYNLVRKLFKKFETQLEEAGLGRYPQIELSEIEPSEKFIDEIKNVADNFEIINDKAWLDEKGAVFGMKYDTFNFYSPKFLLFLKNYLEGKGVLFTRYHLDSLADIRNAIGLNAITAVFNCAGVNAEKIKDVKGETDTYPIRGQVVTVLAPWIKENIGMKRVGVAPTYIIPRPHSNGHVILGGYYDKYDSTESVIREQTESIIQRTTRLYPELLKNGPLHVIDVRAGLRPGRDGGPRIEQEWIGDLNVIHNYGAAGTGYQCGLGMASRAVETYLKSTENRSKI